MRRTGSFIKGAITLAGVILLTLVAFDANLLGQDRLPGESPMFQANIGTHESLTKIQTAPKFPGVSETFEQAEFDPPPPTRSSFMARWDRVTDATGYLLDVSTSDSFSDYVDGYHDLDVGNVVGRAVTGLNRGTTYYYRVRSYNTAGPSSFSEVMTLTTTPTTGLTIHPTFDSSIINNPNAAAIEAMINRAISILESLFTDPITIQIRFRYATTAPNGTPLPAGALSRSDWVYYAVPWNTYINALRADAKTSNDSSANASLPGTALSTYITPSSAAGRVVALNTPTAMFADGTAGQGGPYDGIVTLNSSKPFRFTRPPGTNYFDAQRATEHEIDEVIGIGSHLNISGTYAGDFRPQDLFSWSSPNHRNVTSTGTRYFSINSGATNVVNLNQNPNGDFGDWLSAPCPQAHPYVQNAFSCTDQSSDVAATSPEGINLDVIGYDLSPPPPTGPPVATTSPATNVASFSATLNGTVNPSGLATAVHFQYGTTTNYGFNTASHSYTGNTTQNVSANISGLSASTTYHFRIVATNGAGTRYGMDRIFTTPSGRAAVADFNGDSHPDFVVQKASTRQTAIWYLNNNVFVNGAYGPTLAVGWGLRGVADFNIDSHIDYALFAPSTRQTAIWYLSGPTFLGGVYGPTLPSGWEVVGATDFNGDSNPDYVLYKAITHQTAIWYLNNNVLMSGEVGPTLPSGWTVGGVADFDGDGHPDYALFHSRSGSTAIYYLSGASLVGAAWGPSLPGSWTLVATADFDGDGKPDYVLYNNSTRQTAIWYLNNNVLVNGAVGPTLPVGWSLVGP